MLLRIVKTDDTIAKYDKRDTKLDTDTHIFVDFDAVQSTQAAERVKTTLPQKVPLRLLQSDAYNTMRNAKAKAACEGCPAFLGYTTAAQPRGRGLSMLTIGCSECKTCGSAKRVRPSLQGCPINKFPPPYDDPDVEKLKAEATKEA